MSVPHGSIDAVSDVFAALLHSSLVKELRNGSFVKRVLKDVTDGRSPYYPQRTLHESSTAAVHRVCCPDHAMNSSMVDFLVVRIHRRGRFGLFTKHATYQRSK